MSARMPPKNVPTLTEVVQRPPHASSEPAGAREERLVQRILGQIQQRGGAIGVEVRAQVVAVGGTPVRDESVDDPEPGVGARELPGIAARIVHPLTRPMITCGEIRYGQGTSQALRRCVPHASRAAAPKTVSSPVSTVRPGPKAIVHTRSSVPGTAPRRACGSGAPRGQRCVLARGRAAGAAKCPAEFGRDAVVRF